MAASPAVALPIVPLLLISNCAARPLMARVLVPVAVMRPVTPLLRTSRSVSSSESTPATTLVLAVAVVPRVAEMRPVLLMVKRVVFSPE